jgi:two-component system sensor kinase FixL
MSGTAYLEDFVQKARQEADRLRSVLDTAVDGIITIKRDGTIESFNPAAERIFGYSAADVVGKNIRVLMPPPHQEEHDGYLQRYLSTRQPHIIGIGREVRGRRKDGSLLPIELAVGECGAGDDIRFTGFVRDITLRKEQERQLREQAQLLDNVHEAILVCDLENNITYWNQGAERLYGWTTEEAVGKNRHILKLCLSPYGKNIEDLNRIVLREGEWHQRWPPRDRGFLLDADSR